MNRKLLFLLCLGLNILTLKGGHTRTMQKMATRVAAQRPRQPNPTAEIDKKLIAYIDSFMTDLNQKKFSQKTTSVLYKNLCEQHNVLSTIKSGLLSSQRTPFRRSAAMLSQDAIEEIIDRLSATFDNLVKEERIIIATKQGKI